MAQENTTKKTEVQKQETPTTTAQVKKIGRKMNKLYLLHVLSFP
jgi:hypothetical protein